MLSHSGANWPIMNVFERALCVLGCKYVDDVVIGCPWAVTDDLMKTFNVSLVVQGTSQVSHQHLMPRSLPFLEAMMMIPIPSPVLPISTRKWRAATT